MDLVEKLTENILDIIENWYRLSQRCPSDAALLSIQQVLAASCRALMLPDMPQSCRDIILRRLDEIESLRCHDDLFCAMQKHPFQEMRDFFSAALVF